MRCFDVVNGDADGLCALRQLRLARPARATLVTGLKRDIELLSRVDAKAGDRVTVLDVSLDRNRGPLESMLARGVQVAYFDHHHAGPVPRHPGLVAVIDESASACTSLLVDRHVFGAHRAWAIAGAFGDDLAEEALALARLTGLDAQAVGRLRELGECLNYNAYGDEESDVVQPPAALYRAMAGYEDPLAFAAGDPIVATLAQARARDLERALAVAPARATAGTATYLLPEASWSRRVAGALANRLAASDPARAQAVLRPGREGWTACVRVPSGRSPTAGEFCARFPRGGGRARAGGIDRLPTARLPAFHRAFESAWP